MILNSNCRRSVCGFRGYFPKFHSPPISPINQKHCLRVFAQKVLKSHDTLALNSNCHWFGYGLGSSLTISQAVIVLISDFILQPIANTLKAWCCFILLVANLRQALCGMLNLHGRGFQVREDPPVLLRFYTYLFLNPGSSNTWPHRPDLTLPRLLCAFSKRSKPYALVLKKASFDYINIVLCIVVVALLWVAFAPARLITSTPFSTSQSLMTVTNLSSFADDLSSFYDLTSVNPLPNHCHTALLVSNSLNSIYLFKALGNVFLCIVLNCGSFKSSSLYSFLFR